jgi:hypothetical protein
MDINTLRDTYNVLETIGVHTGGGESKTIVKLFGG